MTTHYVNPANANYLGLTNDNTLTINNACTSSNPGDIIEIDLPDGADIRIECSGALKNPITIRSKCLFNNVILKGQYLDVTLNCKRMEIIDSIGLSLLFCNIDQLCANNIAMITIFNVNFDEIEIIGGTKNDVNCCNGNTLKITNANHSVITDNTVKIITLTGSQPNYKLGLVGDNVYNQLNINNGVVNYI